MGSLMKLALLGLLALGACATTDPDREVLGNVAERATVRVVTLPEGATATAVYGAEWTTPRTISCTTPCDLSIPVIAPFRISFVKPGYVVSDAPQIRWRYSGMHWRIDPEELTIMLSPTPASAR